MKVLKENHENSKFAQYLKKCKEEKTCEKVNEEDALFTEASNMNLYEVEFTVDGVRSADRVRASDSNSAHELVKKKYPDNAVSFTSTKIVSDDKIQEEYDDDISFVIVSDENAVAEDDKKDTELETPKASDFTISSLLNNLIIGEWKTIDDYDAAIITARDMGLDDLVRVMTDIQNEENVHIGQLQKCLQTLTSSVDKIDDGEKEAEEQISDKEEVIDNTQGNYISDTIELSPDKIDDTFNEVV